MLEALARSIQSRTFRERRKAKDISRPRAEHTHEQPGMAGRIVLSFDRRIYLCRRHDHLRSVSDISSTRSVWICDRTAVRYGHGIGAVWVLSVDVGFVGVSLAAARLRIKIRAFELAEELGPLGRVVEAVIECKCGNGDHQQREKSAHGLVHMRRHRPDTWAK